MCAENIIDCAFKNFKTTSFTKGVLNPKNKKKLRKNSKDSIEILHILKKCYDLLEKHFESKKTGEWRYHPTWKGFVTPSFWNKKNSKKHIFKNDLEICSGIKSDKDKKLIFLQIYNHEKSSKKIEPILRDMVKSKISDIKEFNYDESDSRKYHDYVRVTIEIDSDNLNKKWENLMENLFEIYEECINTYRDRLTKNL